MNINILVCHKVLVLVCILCLSGCVSNPQIQLTKTVLSDNWDWASNSEQFEIPFQTISNNIIVPVRINDKPFSFLFDTGSPVSVLFENEKTHALSLTPLGTLPIGGHGNGEQSIADIIPLSKLQIGELVAHNTYATYFKASSTPLLTKTKGLYYDGIIGLDMLKQFIVEVDYDKKILTFYKSLNADIALKNKSQDKVWTKVPYQLNDLKIVINAHVETNLNNKQDVTLIYDTGATHSVLLYNKTLQEQISLDKSYDTSALGVNGIEQRQIGKASFLKIGKLEISTPELAINSEKDRFIASTNGSIGYGIYSKFNTIFNHSEKYMLLSPSKHFNEEARFDRSGLQMMPHEHSATIFNLNKWSHAHQLGLKEGYEVISISGIRANLRNFQKINRLLNSTSDVDNVEICWKAENSNNETCDSLQLKTWF